MIWLIGCKGMLGTEVSNQLEKNNFSWIGTDREVDITNYESLEDFANKNSSNDNQIDWIINCAAYTAVDKAEEDVEMAQKLNALGPKNIATLCKNIGAKMIHISTDYVFDGTATTPYTEDIPYKPLGVYGVTKAEGEKEVLSILPKDSFIIRTAWLYGFYGKNFVFTMINLMNTKDKISVVSDQFGTPTNAQNLANVICTIINKSKSENIPTGVYHCTDLGQTNWYEFAKEIHHFGIKYGKITGNCVVNPCTTEEYPVKAKRPAYSVLSKDKLMKNLNITLPDWKQNLEEFIKNIQ